MKVLHIIDSGGIHGAEVMLLGLAAEQIRQGIEPTILSIGLPGEKEKSIETEARNRGVPYIAVRMRAGLNFIGAFKIVRIANQNKFQILHSHGYKGNILFGFIPLFIRKLPIISTIHGWTAVTKWSAIGAYRLIDKISLRFINRVVFVNNSMARQPLAQKLGNRAVFIPNGIAPLHHSQPFFPNKKISDFCQNAFVVGSIGRLSAEKAYDHLIGAFVRFCEQCSSAKLLIIGEGGERTMLEDCVKKHRVTERVLMPGYFPEAWRYMRLLKIYAISSLTEGLPITLLEAMQCRIPVISTDVGGIAEVLLHGEAGILTRAGDVDELVQGLKKLYSDKDICEKLIDCAFKIVNARYTASAMVAQYSGIYKQVCTLNG